MTKYMLNSPILTSFGEWRYQGPLSLGEARDFVAEGPVVSAIGHGATAEYLQGLLGVPVECTRRQVQMVVGDRALVLQITERLPEGTVLDVPALSQRKSAFGILERLA